MYGILRRSGRSDAVFRIVLYYSDSVAIVPIIEYSTILRKVC